ncbi:MAG TPA: NADH-quinone oxidoreductase subunit N [Phycisphaerae bacterium]
MNGLSAYLTTLAPEIVLTVGACAAILLGGRRAAPVALLATLLAFGWVLGAGIDETRLPGLRFNALSFYVRAITLGVGLLILLVNWHLPVAAERGEFFGMILFSMTGVMLTGAANDLLVLFFSLELVSVPIYVLVALSSPDKRASEASVKYFFLGALTAALMVYGFSFLYGVAGTTELFGADGGGIAGYLAGGGMRAPYALIGLALAFAGIAFKLAAFPFHVYAPDVYQGAASTITGLLAFLPKLAGLTALTIVLLAAGWNSGGRSAAIMWLLWIIAAGTMTVGNVLALLQHNAKRILGYSSIAHSGYMLIGVLAGPAAGEGPLRDGTAAMLFYIVVYGVMNLGAFAALGAISVDGRPAEELEDLNGVARTHPGLALALAICVFSLMGLPPTAGFLGKVYVFSSAFSLPVTDPFRVPMIALGIIGVVNAAIGAAYYLRIAAACYLTEVKTPQQPAGDRALRFGLALCALAMLILFVWPRGLSRQAQQASRGLTSSEFRTASVSERR